MAGYADLGEILIAEQLVGREQLAQAARVGERLGHPLVTVLLEQALVSEDQLVRALQRRLPLQMFVPDQTLVDPSAVREVPYDDALRYRLLPIQAVVDGDQRVLRVAMADPLDRQAIEQVEYATGSVVEPLVGRPSELMEAIRTHYRGVVTQIIPRPLRGGPASDEPAASSDDGAATGPRQPFGGDLVPNELTTRPISPAQRRASTAHKVDALIALLIHKRLITAEELEEQLESLVEATIEATEEEP